MTNLFYKIKQKMDKKYGNNENYHSLSRILPYFRPYLFRTFLALGLAIPIGALDAVIALALKPYMDIVMLNKQIHSTWYIPFLIILLFSLSLIIFSNSFFIFVVSCFTLSSVITSIS